MPVKCYLGAKQRTHVKVYTDEGGLEERAAQQLLNVNAMPFIHHHIAAMPDVHLGMGATIGSVIPTKGAIIPAAVGVDIGCGMLAVKLNLTANHMPDNLKPFREVIEAAVPHGRTDNGGKNDKGAWGKTPDGILNWWAVRGIESAIPEILEAHPGILKGNVNTHRHLGTLGTGNHFIERCLDENDDVWVMLHTGSRGIGNRIGSYFIQLAKKDMEKWFIRLPDRDLSYLPQGTDHFAEYVAAVGWAQEYAKFNREYMLASIMLALSEIFPGVEETTRVIDCHHNYISQENHFGANVWVTRKGAIRARKGDLGIIPGSMGTKSYIVEGLGNKDSLCSCSHGAGRKMSRTQARKEHTVADLELQTAGVECRKDEGVLDELPGAYKDIDTVMENQSDLVRVVHTLKQIVNVKG